MIVFPAWMRRHTANGTLTRAEITRQSRQCDRFPRMTVRTERFTRAEIVQLANVAGRRSCSISPVKALATNARAGPRDRSHARCSADGSPRESLPKREESDAGRSEKRRRED